MQWIHTYVGGKVSWKLNSKRTMEYKSTECIMYLYMQTFAKIGQCVCVGGQSADIMHSFIILLHCAQRVHDTVYVRVYTGYFYWLGEIKVWGKGISIETAKSNKHTLFVNKESLTCVCRLNINFSVSQELHIAGFHKIYEKNEKILTWNNYCHGFLSKTEFSYI